MKQGRNEICKCGSGIKYKKCCLKKETKSETITEIIIEPHSLILEKYLSENRIDIDTEITNYRKNIFDSVDANLNTIEKIEKCIEECEKLISSVASNHNTYDLLFWSRRIAPSNLFDISDLSVMLYKDTQTLSIYKYGKSEINTYSNSKIGIVPQNLKTFYTLELSGLLENIKSKNLPDSIIKILSDTIRLEILCYIFIDLTQFYRIANKGASLVFNESKIHHSMTNELKYLIDIYDERLSKVNLFSIPGTYLNEISKFTKDKLFCPFFQVNVNLNSKIKLFNSNEELRANYLLGYINLTKIYEFLKLFENEFLKKYDYTIEDFIVFLGLLSKKVISNIFGNTTSEIHIFKRAYSMLEYDLDTLESSLNSDYKSIYKNITGNEISSNQLNNSNNKKLLQDFLLNENNKLDINLWTRGPKKIIYQISKNQIVIDYTGLTDIITYKIKELTMSDGKVGNVRALTFEESLTKEITENFDKWVCQKEINSLSNKKEIDGSFIIEDILFILEAKSVNISFGHSKGDKKALDFRKNKMKSALKELVQKCDFIKKNQANLNPSIPSNIKYLCPIVISSFPEYIWEKSEELFLSYENKLPRIITVNDLNQIKRINLKEIRNKNYVVKL
ncbi:YecA family protein [Tenacibaculum finnmarkense]|uniref:YecA family protein n=1 Tax=Tenacibaculum finnmarkense TaxID=2781243 RepID=UPI000C3F00FE|nr:SEC-C domain-containing protein [Tenacibaculum finnmarkense]MCD8440932.1 SEC-C domain-containing protein [Tenacibaculum finnmarkense genomovar ulcerans]SOS56312.1 conserved hypothetical protein [Tenacibaculum finnmarkense]